MMLDRVADEAGALLPLKTALAAGQLPHAVLLAAPDGCGRNFAARCLMADWLYPAGGPGAEAVMRGESPEVLTVAGEGKSGQIPVERIREVRSDVYLSALSAAGRAVHIRDAHHMAAPAANALLKVLEEPPADVLFVLTATQAGALPATIASRCARYVLAPLSTEACEALLRQHLPGGEDPALPGLLALLYGGRAGLGLRVLKDAARLAVLRDALQAADAAGRRDAYAFAALLARYEGRAEGERERREALLADLAAVLEASLLRLRAGGLPEIPAQRAATLLGPVNKARAALRGNAAAKITFTELAVQLCGSGRA